MKNKISFIFFFYFLFQIDLFAENLKIESKKITINKNSQTSIFEDEVLIVTSDNKTIKSDFAEYNKSTGIIKLRKNVNAVDDKNNIINAEYAEYNENLRVLKTVGLTKIVTSEMYKLEGENIILDDTKKMISSKNNTIIIDQNNNKIFLEKFEYHTVSNIFKSVGYVKIIDNLNNTYEFSQIYIDTNKKELLGTDIKAYLNDENFKINEKNKPRVFANTLKIEEKESSFGKSIFTLCDYREKDKCPPWTIQSKKMLHDSKKKTIYYDNAIVKVYDIPIFYFPKLSHPDPTVDRRSGFLPPSFSNTKNLGSGISIPYFWALGNDKNFTLTSRYYLSENPLLIGEYHQAFKKSFLFADFGFTEGYKKTTSTKKKGNKSHLFSKFSKNFNLTEDSENLFEVTLQNVSDDKYLKLYKVKSRLVDDKTNTLENSLKFSHEDEDMFLGINASIYETLIEGDNDKYEYIYPEITVDKNLINNEKIGNIDLQSNYKVRKYDTNKFSNFLVNDLNWNFKEINFFNGFKTKLLGNIKNVNYETKNLDIYKKDTTSEIYGAIGHLSEINLFKRAGLSEHLLKPKMLIRYSPGGMRKEEFGYRLDPINAFNINRADNKNNFENGLSSTLGLDYKIKSKNSDFDFSVAQIINDTENKKMHPETSLDEKLSDVVGSAIFNLNDNFSVNYNFSLDQNYSELNYNELGTVMNFDPFKLDFNYLLENKHIGDKEYFKTKIDINNKDGLISFETKRNLITNSAEFYNLSYEYLNDCLRAGIVYRREFYTDSELEPENSLMFKVTLTPFGNIGSPSFSQ